MKEKTKIVTSFILVSAIIAIHSYMSYMNRVRIAEHEAMKPKEEVLYAIGHVSFSECEYIMIKRPGSDHFEIVTHKGDCTACKQKLSQTQLLSPSVLWK